MLKRIVVGCMLSLSFIGAVQLSTPAGASPKATCEPLAALINAANLAQSTEVVDIVLRADCELPEALPVISSKIRIQSHGGHFAISRNAGNPKNFRILEVWPGGDLTLKKVTVTGGNPPGEVEWGDPGTTSQGGGILNYGNLNLEDSIVAVNTGYFGGGISNWGTATLNRSTVDGNTSRDDTDGGGIKNHGGAKLTISKSAVSNNSSTYWGGGIFNTGTLEVIQSTVTGNTAVYQGGGIENFCCGATAVLDRSTVSGNRSGPGGGIHNYEGTKVTLIKSSVVDNLCDNYLDQTPGMTALTMDTKSVIGPGVCP